jgi:Hemerythrin HHE cation binding domain
MQGIRLFSCPKKQGQLFILGVILPKKLTAKKKRRTKMSNFVEELKQEHTVIFETLNKVKALGITSEEGRNTLFAAKRGLLAHLKREDEQLYPVLNKAAESDAGLKRTLDMFAEDMEEISKTALEFFEKYSKNNSDLDFARDFGKLCAILSKRISQEENIIYKEYNELK